MPDRDDLGSAWKVPPSRYLAGRPAEHRVGAPSSVYVTMPDGCRLAVDVMLPDGDAAKRFPTVLILTPYFRRFERRPAQHRAHAQSAKYRDFFVPRGYAMVVVDVRGSGASFGTRDSFRSPRERDDYREIADWIVAQPWSNGVIGSTGISYLGAAAFSGQHRPPRGQGDRAAVRRVGHLRRPRVSGRDVMKRLARSTTSWCGRSTSTGATGGASSAISTIPRCTGRQPVDEDAGRGSLAREAVKGHLVNFRMPDFIGEFKFRDDALPYDPSFTSASFGPYNYLDKIPKDVAVYAISGWMDGAGYANGTLSRFLTLPNAERRIMLGPWDHGARVNAYWTEREEIRVSPASRRRPRWTDRGPSGG